MHKNMEARSHYLICHCSLHLITQHTCIVLICVTKWCCHRYRTWSALSSGQNSCGQFVDRAPPAFLIVAQFYFWHRSSHFFLITMTLNGLGENVNRNFGQWLSPISLSSSIGHDQNWVNDCDSWPIKWRSSHRLCRLINISPPNNRKISLTGKFSLLFDALRNSNAINVTYTKYIQTWNCSR